jgi:hypothetical protein
MGVLERGSPRPAVILEQQNVAQPGVALEIQNAIAKGPKQVFVAFFRQLRPRYLVLEFR